MTEVGKAELTIIPSFKGGQTSLERQLAGSTGGLTGAGKSAGTAFMGGMRSVIGPATAILGTAALTDFASSAIDQASSVGESVNALNVVFGEAAQGVIDLGEAASGAKGLSSLDFNNLSVQFSNFVKTVAGDGGDVVGTLDDLTTRAADFASVMNIDVSDAASLFQSGLAGETEPLRRYGIDLSAAAVDAYAYANGIAETGEQLTEAQKVQARYGALMAQTNQTAGDFANTSDSLANQQRILNAEWENMQAQLGTALLPVMQDVTGWLLDDGLPALQGFITDLGDPSTAIGGMAESLGNLWESVSPTLQIMASESGGLLSEVVDGTARIITAFNEGGVDGAILEATAVGGDLSEWAAAGEGFAHEFIGGVELVMKSFAEGTVAEDWLGGMGIIASDWWDGWTGMQRDAWDKANGYTSAEAATMPKAASAQALTAMSAQTWGAGNALQAAPTASNTIVNIGTVNATDTNDIIRQSQKAARTNAWSGSRSGRVNAGMR